MRIHRLVRIVARTLAAVLALLASACVSGPTVQSVEGNARFADASWDDGMAVVSTFEGRVRRYGTWRDAIVRDYLVREYLDPQELTKRNTSTPELVPVLKANRLIEFSTGSYDYRLMSSLFFRRDTCALQKGVGSCLNACGLVFQRWDSPSATLRSDSYWEHEGRAEWPLAAGSWRFADELAFVARELDDGARVRVLPPLASPHSMLQPRREEGEGGAWLGIGDLCTECVIAAPEDAAQGTWSELAGAPREARARTLFVQREGRLTRFLADDGTVALELVHDEHGFLAGWTLPGEQEFRRVSIFRGPYWERTDPADRALVEP
jgi:hypothetical protein